VSACVNGKKGEGYILGNRYVSVDEILYLVHQLTGAKLVKHMVPVWAVRTIVPLFGIYYRIKKRPPIFTRYSLYTLTGNSVYSSQKAKRELGFTVRPFEQTIADALKWLKDEGRV
jgi:dihydroflavonol-4-reductase